MKSVCGLLSIMFVCVGSLAQSVHGRDGIQLPPPPRVQADPVDDNYNGIRIADSYRWLEDANSPETRAFVDVENEYTSRYFRQATIRSKIESALESLEHVATWDLPIQRMGYYYFLKREAGEDQASIFLRRGWTGKDERLLDPAVLSRDRNTSLTLEDVSRDGNLIAYGVRQGGADETALHIFDAKTRKTLEDTLPAGLYWSIQFTPDGTGLYYTRTTQQGSLLYLHTLGTRVTRDVLIFCSASSPMMKNIWSLRLIMACRLSARISCFVI